MSLSHDNISGVEPGHDALIKKVVVLGGGTAGFLTALALKRYLPDLQVVVIRSTKMGVIGVGEGTIPGVVQFLHRFLGIDSSTLYSEVQASPKLGIRYLWGSRPFFNYTFTGQLSQGHPSLSLPRGYYCRDSFEYADINSALMSFDKISIRLPNGSPKVNVNAAYHLENKKFVNFLEQKAELAGITKIDDTVKHVVTNEMGIQKLILEDGPSIEGDFYVDASGYRAELIGKALGEEFVDFRKALFCDRAVVGGWQRTSETYHPYTTAETMDNGWCWQIEHDDLINRGYVFCSQYASDDQAVGEFKRKNPKLDETKVIPFPAGMYRRSWVKNVVAIGNSAGFVEPLEATAIGMICDGAVRLVKALIASGKRNLPVQQTIFNRITQKNWEIIRDFLALHYKFNTRLDTEFWKTVRADVDIGDTQEYVDYYRQVGPDFSILAPEFSRNAFTAEGYMVMLLGQQVPFERPVNISLDQQQAWLRLKQNLKHIAQGGLSVPEYLQWIRAESNRQEINRQVGIARAGEQKTMRIGDNMKSGELNWL